MANNRHANVKAFRARLKIDGSRYSYANNFLHQATNEEEKQREGKKKKQTFQTLLLHS